MLFRFLFVLYLFAVGCVRANPFFTAPVSKPTQVHTAMPLPQAVQVVKLVLEKELGRKLPSPNVKIIWAIPHKFDREKRGCLKVARFYAHWEQSKKDCLIGYYISPMFDRPEIWLTYNGSLYNSALAHELIHYYKHIVTGFSDGDHSDKKWWKLEEVARKELRKYEKQILLSQEKSHE